MGLAGLLKQEGCVQLCRSSLLVHSPKPPASSSVRDVYWPPKWKSTGTYLLSLTYSVAKSCCFCALSIGTLNGNCCSLFIDEKRRPNASPVTIVVDLECSYHVI